MASSDVVLSAALRNNLLSLQNTQRSIDTVQLRLATGLKINSALDGPQNFFTAKALSNRAGDLTRLLDGINLSLSTLTEADKGVTALSSLIDQAQSIVNNARDELASSTGEARAIGDVDLSGLTTIVGVGGIAANDVVRIVTTSNAGVQVAENITIVAGDSAYSLAAKITDQFRDAREGQIVARVTEDGFLEIRSTDGRSFKFGANANATDIAQAGWDALGLATSVNSQTRGANILVQGQVSAGATIKSISLYESLGNLAEAGDLLTTSYRDVNGNIVMTGMAVGNSWNFNVDIGATTVTSGALAVTATTTIQDLVDQINETAAINPYMSAAFDETTGQLSFTSISDEVENFEIVRITTAVTTFDIGLGDEYAAIDPLTGVGAGTNDYNFAFNQSTQALDEYARDYNTLRDQIDALVEDAQFRGINLLNGDDLTTFFNEDNSNKLVTTGEVFTSDGLGIVEARFRDSTSIEASDAQIKTALASVRSFSASLATSLAIIQTRRDFTQETINTLKAGAETLTVADQNEEGANLLALQTRQQLGVTSLALAAQSQQSVLRLF